MVSAACKKLFVTSTQKKKELSFLEEDRKTDRQTVGVGVTYKHLVTNMVFLATCIYETNTITFSQRVCHAMTVCERNGIWQAGTLSS